MQQRVQSRRGMFLRRRLQMRVRIHRDQNRREAQSFLNDFHRLSRFEHQTGARMAETMKTNAFDVGRLTQCVKGNYFVQEDPREHHGVVAEDTATAFRRQEHTESGNRRRMRKAHR